MSYLVMESRAGYAVVLDNQGRFQKVPNLGYEVGETLDFVTIFPEETAVVTPFRKKMASLVAAAACFLLLFAGSHQLLLTAYGTVRIQINPEVMLEINRLDYVIGLEGMNEDGSRLVEGYRYRGKRLESVSEELADLAMEEGYLRDGGEIVLTVESKHEKWKTDKEAELTERISTHLENKASVKVSVGGPARDNGAGENGLQQGGEKDGMADTPAGEPGQGSIGNPADQTREGMEADIDDDRDDIDDDRDDADDDRDDADDDRDDPDDDRDDPDDDRDDPDDDRDNPDDGRDAPDDDDRRDDIDDDRDGTDEGRDAPDEGRDAPDDDRDAPDDDRDNPEDDRNGTDDRDNMDDNRYGTDKHRDSTDDHDGADENHDGADKNHNGTDNDRDDPDDNRENSDDSREDADDGYDDADGDSDSDDSDDGSYDHDDDGSDSNDDSDD